MERQDAQKPFPITQVDLYESQNIKSLTREKFPAT